MDNNPGLELAALLNQTPFFGASPDGSAAQLSYCPKRVLV